jgi:hypothetical protein
MSRWAVFRLAFPGHRSRPGKVGGSIPRKGIHASPLSTGEVTTLRTFMRHNLGQVPWE